MKKFLLCATIALQASALFGQYNACAGKSEIRNDKQVVVVDEETGEKKITIVSEKPASTDQYGNLKGAAFDLAVDSAFSGQTIFVYNACNVSLSEPQKALATKGFNLVSVSSLPSVEALAEYLKKSCQFWLISGTTNTLSLEHIKLIDAYFKSGRGVYIWGDNTPYHADANLLTAHLFKVTMGGTYYGDHPLGFKQKDSISGIVANHLITTGLETVYEGITISAISDPNQMLTPLMYSTDGQVVTAVYEQQGLRLIIDGGFTRLYYKWDAAGTDRYVKNAAAWLANVERFGTEVSKLASTETKVKTE